MGGFSKALLLGVSALATAPAWAQDQSAGAEADGGLGDIIVTARKTTESLQDVPVAITAFDQQAIQSARIESLQDVARLTPGLNFAPLFGRQNQLPIIRGAAQTFGQLNVGVFLDGIYLTGKAAVDLELNDLERIEVVKGPQSALYGRNTFAGAINYITKRPTRDLSGNMQVEVGNNGHRKVIGGISGPINDSLRVRLGGYFRDFDGFYRSSIDGGRVDFAKSYGGIATIEYSKTDDFIATLRLNYSKDDLGQPASNVIRNNSFPGRPAGSPVNTSRNLVYVGELPSIPRNGVTVNTRLPSGLTSPVDIPDFGDREKAFRGSLTLQGRLAGVQITSLTAYAWRRQNYTFDGDNTICDRTVGCPNFGPTIPFGQSQFALSSERASFRDWSQEFRLQNADQGRFNWLLGFYYFGNKTNSLQRSIAPVSSTGAASFTFPRARSITNAYSAFASVNYAITDQLKITGEFRYEWEEQSFRQDPTNTAAPVTAAAITQATRAPRSLDFSFSTPRVIVDYQIDPDKLIYASYARGAKTGGFNTNLNIFPNQFVYAPEFTDNYEIGFKTDWLDRRLRVNLSAFYIDWKDQQIACQNPVTAGGSTTQRTYLCNVGASDIKGVEFELVARPADWFTLAGNYTYTDARYSKFVDDSLAAQLVLAGRPPIDYNNNFLPYVPRHKFVVSPQFFATVGEVGLEARADATYQSRTYLRAENFQFFGPRTQVDARVTARYAGFSVQAFVSNLFDNKTSTAGVRFFDSTNYSVLSPLVQGANRRQYGVALGYRF